MKKVLCLLFVILIIFTSCDFNSDVNKVSDGYRNYYEVFVRSFFDSNNDGIGDLKGLSSKLDYISKDVGADGIWLMPIMPSPTYHKYDITDYYNIDPAYGNLADFDNFILQSHNRDVKVIIDLVLNHTSNLHPWFQSAVKGLWEGKEDKYISFYNFTLEDKGQGFNKITDKYYYECRFVSGMPDLNLDNSMVRDEILKIVKFWLDKGVDGFRLDAVTSYFTGDNEKNIEFLTWLNKNVKQYKQDAYIVGEAWSDSGLIEEYYKSGVDSFFNFPYSQSNGAIVYSLNNKQGFDFVKSLKDWNLKIKANNKTAKDALFLSNHDNGRSAGFLMRNMVKEKMAAALYLLMPGNPFIYYGEELGMTGSGKDENKRLPMLWSLNSKTGLTSPPPNSTQSIEGIKGADEQIADKKSLLNYYNKILEIKAKCPEIARGDINVIDTGDNEIAAYYLSYKEKSVFVFHNLSDKEKGLDLNKLGINKSKIYYSLVADLGEAKISGNILTIPAFSTTILR